MTRDEVNSLKQVIQTGFTDVSFLTLNIDYILMQIEKLFLDGQDVWWFKERVRQLERKINEGS